MNFKVFTLLIIVFITSSIFAANTLSLNVSVNQDRSIISVDLNLANEDTLSGMQIPLDLGFNRLGLQIDSVSFAGSRCDQFFEQFYTVYPEQNKVFIFLAEAADPEIDSSPLLPGTGKVATIYLSRTEDFVPGDHTITNDRPIHGRRDLGFYFWNQRAEDVTVTFNPALIRLRRH